MLGVKGLAVVEAKRGYPEPWNTSPQNRERLDAADWNGNYEPPYRPGDGPSPIGCTVRQRLMPIFHGSLGERLLPAHLADTPSAGTGASTGRPPRRSSSSSSPPEPVLSPIFSSFRRTHAESP